MAVADPSLPASAGQVITFPDTSDRRLRRALLSLDAALAAQRTAVAELRAQLGALDQAVGGLGASAVALQGSLAGAAAENARAAAAARELQATADIMEALVQR
jgi:hypothetical protein